MNRQIVFLIVIALLLVARAVFAALLPLSADEAYYWLWSRHLALGYYDHPPAIAWLIAAGTHVLGDTPLGVRLSGLVLSIPATWLVWDSARLLLRDGRSSACDAKAGGGAASSPDSEATGGGGGHSSACDARAGGGAASSPDSEATGGGGGRSSACDAKAGGGAIIAALIFNLTLMTSVEMLAATPDMPSIVTAAAMFWALCKVRQAPRAAGGESRAGAWWIAVGVAAGLGLLSKLSVLFLGLGTLIWLLADRDQRRWLATIWPWAGAALALLLYAPALWWQSRHHWETFAFQFGRIDSGHLTLHYLGEFLAAQAGLATPLIFVLMLAGLWAGRKPGTALFLPALLSFTAIAYFLVHALHGRVQGNWPCFLTPMLSVLAAAAFGGRARWWRWLSWASLPLAGVLLAAVYAQAGWGVVPLKHDPMARILGRQFQPVASVVAAIAQAHLADAILTTDYETTAWLRFYQPQVKVIQINEPQRYADAPTPSPALLKGHLLYLVSQQRDQHRLVQQDFTYTGFPTQIQGTGAPWMLYPAARPRHLGFGKMP